MVAADLLLDCAGVLRALDEKVIIVLIVIILG
jgi:hypothetical protein